MSTYSQENGIDQTAREFLGDRSVWPDGQADGQWLQAVQRTHPAGPREERYREEVRQELEGIGPRGGTITIEKGQFKTTIQQVNIMQLLASDHMAITHTFNKLLTICYME